MQIKLVLRRLEEHGLQNGDRVRAVILRHFGKADALARADRADAEVDRDTPRRLPEDDVQAVRHLVLLRHVELAVAAEEQNAVHTALDHEVHLTAQPRLVHIFLRVERRQDRHDDTRKLLFHRITSFAAPVK